MDTRMGHDEPLAGMRLMRMAVEPGRVFYPRAVKQTLCDKSQVIVKSGRNAKWIDKCTALVHNLRLIF